MLTGYTCLVVITVFHCRVPDELRKHYLSDGEGGQYSTNLDRNRYGNDDQYLFTGGIHVLCSCQSQDVMHTCLDGNRHV
jgi:hypothetical protein